jgi:hypothetical protein
LKLPRQQQGPDFMQKVLSFAVALAAMSSCSALAGTTTEDPRAYCARVGDDDQTRPIPPGLVRPALRLFYLKPVVPEQVEKSTVYRCMRGAAWLCNYGANLSCAKADVSRVSKGAENYCQEFPGSTVVPMAATGHDTIYTWECVGKEPRITASEKVDERNFIANQWRRLD